MHKLDVPLAEHPGSECLKELIEMVHYLDADIVNVNSAGSTLTLSFGEREPTNVGVLVRDVNELLRKLSAAHSKDFTEVLYSHGDAIPSVQNPWPWLVDKGLVTQVAPGICYLSGDLLELTERVDLAFKQYAKSLGAVLQSYTSVLPLRSVVDSGYLANFPQHALFVSGAHQSLASLERISSPAGHNSHVYTENLSSPGYLLAPTVCYHCFEALKSSEIRDRAIFSARSLCHRNERSTDTLLRLKTFTMREIIFFGLAEHVEDTRAAILQYCLWIIRQLGLTFRVLTASDPFFASGAEQKRAFQKFTRSKIELQVYVPYRDAWTAVASFNNHSSSLTDKYGIQPHGICSGCFGIGYERFVYSLIAQMGCDIDRAMDALASLGAKQ